MLKWTDPRRDSHRDSHRDSRRDSHRDSRRDSHRDSREAPLHARLGSFPAVGVFTLPLIAPSGEGVL